MASTVENNFARICRLCAEEQDVTIMLFSVDAEAMMLQNKLNSYLLIEVDEDDRLPKNICIQCCSKLQTVCDFIDMARKSQELLSRRCLMLEQQAPVPEKSLKTTIIKQESATCFRVEEIHVSEMQVNVDPMVVLQNNDENMQVNLDESVTPQNNSEDVTFLHNNEDVTIKLIKKGAKDDKKPFPCVVCKRGFCTELALKNHCWVHDEANGKAALYKCSHCGEGFDFKRYLLQHIKQHRCTGMCQICRRVFRNQKNLEAHMAIHRKLGGAFTCRVCGRSYKTRSNLKTHSISHSNERPFNCDLCKKSFKRNQDLKFHLNQHTGAKPYQCPFCDKSFASSGNCYSHRSRMHPGKNAESARMRRVIKRDINAPPRPIAPKPPIISVKGTPKFQCQVCQHSFLKRDNYMYHMFQHTGEKPFQCSFCTEKFVTRRGLLLHHDKTHPNRDRPLALLSKNVLLK